MFLIINSVFVVITEFKDFLNGTQDMPDEDYELQDKL
jgi:hypothetical protein